MPKAPNQIAGLTIFISDPSGSRRLVPAGRTSSKNDPIYLTLQCALPSLVSLLAIREPPRHPQYLVATLKLFSKSLGILRPVTSARLTTPVILDLG